jgi:hypothetical protein
MKHLLLALLSVFLCSCASQNPQTRIQNSRPLYDALSKDHQELVAQGQIAEGMSPSAVYLALGNPDRKSNGRKNGRTFERWDYTSLQPVMVNNFHYGDWGGGRRHHGWSGYGIGQSIEYIPYRSSSVWFLNNKVDSWEFIGNRR